MADIFMALDPIPYRIRIGVTGHRTLENSEALAEKVRALLNLKDSVILDEESRSRVRTSENPPLGFTVFSLLAEGADRLVAVEVLATPDALIHAVLPFEKEEYLKDFVSEDSRGEFENILSKDRRKEDLTKGLSTLGTKADPERRKEAYAKAGRFVVDSCDVLIAVWDGEPAAGRGGTAEIVEYARKKERPLIIVSSHAPFEVTVERRLKLDVLTMDSIREFNAYKVPVDELNPYAINVARDLFAVEESKSIAPKVKTIVLEQLIPFYVKASKVAKHHQEMYLRSGSLVYLFSALAVAVSALFIVFEAYSLLWYSIEAILLLSILLMVRRADRYRTHKKWIESRFLTERIRVAFFFAACGIEVSPIQIPPYLRIAHRPDDWMVRVFDEIWNRLPRLPGCDGAAYAGVSAYIRKALVQDQIKYHNNKAKERGRISSRLEFAGKAIFFAAFVATLLHIGISLIGTEGHATMMSLLLTYLSLSLPAIGAAIAGIHTHREYSRLEKRDQNMVVALTELDERFAHVTDHQVLESLLRETEELMLRETQDWLMLMKFVKLETAA